MTRLFGLMLIGFVWLLTNPLNAAVPEVAELTFDSRWQTPLTATNGLPRWIQGVDQQGGHFATTTNCWYVEAAQPVAAGRLSIRLDRQLLNEDVALAILYDHNDAADFVVQLFDDQNQVIVLDLFGNIMAVGKEAKTDTFIVPLRQFPTATRITIRRVKGDIRVYGAVLYPVVGPEVADAHTLQELAKLMGDKLSPENPLVRSINRIAAATGLQQNWGRPNSPTQSATTPSKDIPDEARKVGDGWAVLPFFADSDWGSGRGEPSMVAKSEILLQGRSVRTLAAYPIPAVVTCDVQLEQRLASDGSLDIFLIPPNLSRDRYPKPMVNIRLIYSNTGDYGSVDRIDINQTDAGGHLTTWSDTTFQMTAGKAYPIQLEATNPGQIHLTIGGKEIKVPNTFRLPYRQFQVQILGWQPTNRWHVRNFNVR